MNHPNPPDELDALRHRRDRLRENLTSRQTAVAAAERQLAEARGRFGDDDRRTVRSRALLERAAEAVVVSRHEYIAARDGVVVAIHSWLDRDVGDDFARLQTALPLVLLPVRIETRFALGGAARELWIRIYPDEIHADSHERELTDDEVEAGRTYWRSVRAEPDAALTAWQLLVQTVPAPRAAWVVRATAPVEPGEVGEEIEFPEPPRKTDDWTRAVEARLLPDRFVAIGYRGGGEVARAVGAPIPEPLAVALAPDASAAQLEDVSGDGLELDEAVRWTVDFDRAVEIGMGIRMPLTADLESGFDELIVVGVKGSLSPLETSSELARLFDEHHYGRGLAFLAQGTPTNNTEQSVSAYPPADPNAERSFAIELDAARTIGGRDGERFARALGVPSETFTHVDRGDADEQSAARAMCGALWPATWGYFFEELLLEPELDDDVDAFRDYFIGNVRARGHHPAFRVGSTPYGALVTSSLSRWVQRGRRGLLESSMPDDLRRLRTIWRESAGAVPRVGRTGDADRDLLEVLEMDASAREVRVRSVVGPNASLNMASFFAIDWDPVRERQLQLARLLAQRLGRVDVDSRIFGLTFGRSAHVFASGFVVPRPAAGEPEPLSETEPLPFNYIRWLREAPSVEDVKEERLPDGVSPPNTLLYRLLRHALLREAARTADRILLNENLVSRATILDRELVGARVAPPPAGPGPDAGAMAIAATATVWERMATRVPSITGDLSLASFVWLPDPRPETRRLREYREFLTMLEDLPTAELERLLTETLDVCSHRLDAWVTSMFAERLDAMRRDRAMESVVGAFGWVIDLRPRPSVATAPIAMPRLGESVMRRLGVMAGASLEQQTSTGGFVHAPSMGHAATAAILRNGFLSRRSQDDQRYGIDLTSRRVRRARWILDSVRLGQPLGAVLGYQFERGLHEGHPPLELDRYKEPFRTLFPLVAGKLTPTDSAGGEAVEAVAARNVVDGLKLHAAWQANAIVWNRDGLPPESGAHFDAIQAELRSLDETIDAVADLLMAESVHQLVKGNTSGASASLDSLSRGVRAPDPEVVKTPRGGTGINHRVALVLGGNPIMPPGWGAVPTTPRAAAEPCLDGWLGTLIGDPGKVRCRASYTDNAPLPAVRDVEVTLAELGLRPIDVLHVLAGAEGEERRTEAEPTATAQASELDSRIAALILARPDADPAGDVRIDYAPMDRDSTRSFPEVAEVMRAAQAVLSTARSLEPKDLLAPSQDDQLDDAVMDEAEITARAGAALTAVTQAWLDLDAAASPLMVEPTPVNADRSALVAALRGAAAFGVAGAFVPRPHTDHAATPDDVVVQQEQTMALLVQAASVIDELKRRIDAATEHLDPRLRLAALFGDALRPLVRFTPVEAVLSQALSAGPAPPPTPAEVREWARCAALVRAPLERFHRLTLMQRALGGSPAPLKVTQLPHRPGAAWVALPFPDEESRPVAGTLGLALFAAAQPLPGAADAWVGLMIDEWTELIPSREEETAVTFHYDDPGAEAPQAVLIAVPPDDASPWTLDAVSDVLRETLELARLRAVDGDLLGSLSQLLPATYLASNSRFDTVAVTFEGALLRDALIVGGS